MLQVHATTAPQRMFAAIVVGLSLAAFAAMAPFAKVQLAEVRAFIPAYQGALVVNDLVTAFLLFGQFEYFRSRALLVLACGYAFTASMAVVHALSFPGLFSPTGLLGAGVQTTAWLYMFWHAGFPICVVAYKMLEGLESRRASPPAGARELRICLGILVIAVAAATLLATTGAFLLPDVMVGHTMTPTIGIVGGLVWGLSLGALYVVWHRRSGALDMWLCVVMVAWMLDIGLSVLLNHGRFDLGFYAGRIYGLVAATMVLAALLVENGRMYRAVREHTNDIERARRAAIEAERAKGAFVASMSHEIRTPMNGVLGMLELLSLTALTREQRSTVEVTRQSARSLVRILDDILDYSKMVAGKLELRPEAASVREVVERACRVFGGNAESKGIGLTWTVDSGVGASHLFDPLRLQQIVQNLVSNAVKFTGVGRVSVNVTPVASSDEAQRLRIAVEDTGPGIRPEDEARIFRDFSQGGGPNPGGTGLGLAISRRLATLMGGTLEARSELGSGTTMILQLPMQRCAVPPAAAAMDPVSMPLPLPGHRGRGQKILIVDDHPVNRLVLARQLATLGYRVDSAQTGAQALEKWSAGGIAAVITDCHMPVMDGHELARRIRAAEAGGSAHVPIIACSANVMEGEAARCLESGMDDYLAKPVTLEMLGAKLERWFPPEERASIGGASLERVMAEFWRCNDQDLHELREAVAISDFDVACRSAHRIKGAAAAVGAWELANLGADLERAARAGNWSVLQHDLGALESACKRLRSENFVMSQLQ